VRVTRIICSWPTHTPSSLPLGPFDPSPPRRSQFLRLCMGTQPSFVGDNLYSVSRATNERMQFFIIGTPDSSVGVFLSCARALSTPHQGCCWEIPRFQGVPKYRSSDHSPISPSVNHFNHSKPANQGQIKSPWMMQKAGSAVFVPSERAVFAVLS
jgi:hypothetical protein